MVPSPRMQPFDPADFKFVRLTDFEIPGGVPVFEYGNHPTVSGAAHFLRLNLYLALDGSYATIWYGLLDPIFAQAQLETLRASVRMPTDADFVHSYDETLFRGHIESPEIAAVIFNALRIGQDRRYELPQELRAGEDAALGCYPIEGVAVRM